MKLPSLTLRTRSFVGSNVSVSVKVEMRAASEIEIGTVYGPPPTRNVGPVGEMMICAAPIPGDCVGTAAGSAVVGVGLGGTVAGAGFTAAAWGGGGTTMFDGGCVWVGCGASTTPGTGVDPGGTATCVPPGPCIVAPVAPVGPAGAGGGVGSTGAGCAISGGGPLSPRFCCDPM